MAPLTLDRSLAVLGILKAIEITDGDGWPLTQGDLTCVAEPSRIGQAYAIDKLLEHSE